MTRSFVSNVVEPMFEQNPIPVAFKKRLDLELENLKNNPQYGEHMTYPPEIETDPDNTGLRIIETDLVKTGQEEGGVSVNVKRTSTAGVYLIIRSRLDDHGKSQVSKSLTFVGSDRIFKYEANPDDLKPLE